MNRYVAVVRVILLAMVAVSAMFAQRDLGTITGTITDPQGGAVANARVTIIEDATGLTYEAQTDQSGTYSRPLLKPGTYTVSVEAPGFRKSEQKGVIVNPGERTAANIGLAGRKRLTNGGSFRRRAPAADRKHRSGREPELHPSQRTASGRPAYLHVSGASLARRSAG